MKIYLKLLTVCLSLLFIGCAVDGGEDGSGTGNGNNGNDNGGDNNPVVVIPAVPLEDLKFTLSLDGTYYSVASNVQPADLSGRLVIPETYEGKPVREIDDYGFQNHTNIVSLTIPNSITTIGQYAFNGCTGLKGDLIIPNSVTTMKTSAFYGCSGLDGTLTLSNNLEVIEVQVFAECNSLSGSLEIPPSVKTIKRAAFAYCSSFTGNLVIPDTVTTLEGAVFTNCFGFNGNLIISSSLTVINDTMFSGCTGITGQVEIPSSVTVIQGAAFDKTDSIESVKFQTISAPVLGDYNFTNSSTGFNPETNIIAVYVPTGSIGAYQTAFNTNSSYLVDKLQEY